MLNGRPRRWAWESGLNAESKWVAPGDDGMRNDSARGPAQNALCQWNVCRQRGMRGEHTVAFIEFCQAAALFVRVAEEACGRRTQGTTSDYTEPGDRARC